VVSAPEEGERGVPTVLVVEDEAGVRTVLVSMLRRMTDCAIEDHSTAAEALEAARSQRYGIAVLDVGMAPMDGIELAARLRALQPGLPIVFLTGSLSGDYERARTAGAVAVLQKPTGIRAVGDVVRTHVLREGSERA
jgi:CheY-like chemotaxis protein